MTKTDEKWFERIGQWRESGKTAEEFTVGQPYKASTLKWRAAELQRRAEGGKAYGGAEPDAVRLTRVVARSRNSLTPGAGGLIVEVSGARIVLSRGFDAALLTDVVRALGAAR
ncbi:MAG TPA: hypothetical protein VGL19_01305 [Polyangiaceae bacterium]|jgi:hypothetical protein